MIENVDHWLGHEHTLSASVAGCRSLGGAIRRNRRLRAWKVRQKAGTAHAIALRTIGSRSDSETQIDGGVLSTQGSIVGRLLFVPAGQEFRSWAVPGTDQELTAIHIDPRAPFLDKGLDFAKLGSPARSASMTRSVRGLWRSRAR
jgi:hypothetical protein